MSSLAKPLLRAILPLSRSILSSRLGPPVFLAGRFPQPHPIPLPSQSFAGLGSRRRNPSNSSEPSASTASGPLEALGEEEFPQIEAPSSLSAPQQLGKIEPRLSMTFTCTASDCGHRSTHEFSRRSYEKGIVLVQCPSCKNRHLVADHLGWFNDATGDGKNRTVEDLLRAKGETIRKGRVNIEGDVEWDGSG